MLRTLASKLRCPFCIRGPAPLTLHDFDPEAQRGKSHVENGVLVCTRCSELYTIEDGLAELVPPPLKDAESFAGFVSRFKSELAVRGLQQRVTSTLPDEAGVADQLKQRKHFDWYADNESQSYEDYQGTPFWRASDEQTLRRWRPRVPAGSWILDVGCADGRGGFYFTELPGMVLIGFDISRKMVANAIRRARREGFYERASFLVADAASLPFGPETFDVAITFGVLHHLPDPGKTSRDIQVVLRAGGVHLALENNLSMVRPLFDLMMRVLPLWSEEAGREPLISKAMVSEWLRPLPIRLTSATSVFVPPHLLNWIGLRAADAVLRTTDAICSRLPLIRHNGGLIVFEVEKTAHSA